MKKLGTKTHPYCSNIKCEDKTCVRRWEYAPRDILLWREHYEKNSKGVCKDKINEL